MGAENGTCAEVSAANYAFFLGATNDNLDEILQADYTRIPGVKLFMGSSTGNMLVDNDSEIRRLFARFHRVIACHAESEEIITANRQQTASPLSRGYPCGVPQRDTLAPGLPRGYHKGCETRP